ncbi:unnamed protein product [Discosporangium mesarthrocarpum]
MGVAAGAVAPGVPTVKKEKKEKKEKKPKDQEDEVDDLFGDDEEEAPTEEAPTQMSRAEKMAAAKKEKEKKKKIDRSQVVLEVKPWEADTDLKKLFEKITKVEIAGLAWGEAMKLVPVAFGVKKLVISCVVEDDKVGVEDITDAIEAFEDDVQSVDMTTMNRL